MQTECISKQLEFKGLGGKRVVAVFDGGAMTSDAGALLLRQADWAVGLSRSVTSCFTDGRCQELIEHELQTLISQRIHGIALGYEDLNDHDDLRYDPVFGLLSGKLKPRRSDCTVLAGKSTLNRLERTPKPKTDEANLSRYHKISYDDAALERVFPAIFLNSHQKAPDRIILDADATDDPLHGNQEGRFFHGYYGCYCYLPLYIFCGHDLLCAKLRPANIDGAAGTLEEVERIVKQIREKWPDVEIWLRADSGFARDDLMTWCEKNKVEYVIGLAKNKRLLKEIKPELEQAKQECEKTGKAYRLFKDFQYKPLENWPHERRVTGKAEHLPNKSNPRFIVTSLKSSQFSSQELYEKIYCARGGMENRIKECQLDLMSDRTSSATMRANQLRLWFSALAYVLMTAVRRIGLAGTQFAKATAGTIRNKLLKIGALVKVSVRRVTVSMASACPYQEEFVHAWEKLRTAAA